MKNFHCENDVETLKEDLKLKKEILNKKLNKHKFEKWNFHNNEIWKERIEKNDKSDNVFELQKWKFKSISRLVFHLLHDERETKFI